MWISQSMPLNSWKAGFLRMYVQRRCVRIGVRWSQMKSTDCDEFWTKAFAWEASIGCVFATVGFGHFEYFTSFRSGIASGIRWEVMTSTIIVWLNLHCCCWVLGLALFRVSDTRNRDISAISDTTARYSVSCRCSWVWTHCKGLMTWGATWKGTSLQMIDLQRTLLCAGDACCGCHDVTQ